jgi:hypothetical protein
MQKDYARTLRLQQRLNYKSRALKKKRCKPKAYKTYSKKIRENLPKHKKEIFIGIE